jgi:hypothetical protein
MKIKSLAFSLTAVAALAVAIPALAASHQGARPRGDSAAANDVGAHRAAHAKKAKTARRAAAGPSAPFTATIPDAAAQAGLARSGSIVLPVSFNGPGTVTAEGESPVGSATSTVTGTAPDGHPVPITVPRDFAPAIDSTSVTATAAGTVGLKLTLTGWARSELAAGHDLEVYLMLSPSQGPSETVPGLGMVLQLPGS